LPVLSAIVLRVFFFEMYKIPSSSMVPTLIPGDYIIVNKFSNEEDGFKWNRLLKITKN